MNILFFKYKVYFILVDFIFDIGLYNVGVDLYLLILREDFFLNVVLEVLDVKFFVIGFKNVGGFEDVVIEKIGVLVDFLNLFKMLEKIYEFIYDEGLWL